ncbi:DUF5067 domain-containing protein [Eremococcus coleocola]|uniref:DUF5067 domain-containing protein n=1 Tax=Eremococcus coleocola TaxID=88132 RepID=UPI0003FD208D|nr:DUF5067 domain-containing protein [Eremococcus coleocola]
MNKKLLLVASAMVLVNTAPTFAQDKDKIDDLKTQIEAKKNELKDLEAQLKELTGEKSEGDFGQAVTIEDVTITINKAYYSTDLNEMSDIKADKVLVIEYTVQNDSNDEIFANMNIDVYADGKKLDTYPYTRNKSEKISAGKAADLIAGYAIVGEPKELELEFRPQYIGEIGNDTVKIATDGFETVEE